MTTSIFGIMNTAKTALLTQQLAIEVTGQNIANVQTEGFSRQSVVLDTSTPRTTGIGQVGTGVRVSGIERAHDAFIFSQLVTENTDMGEFQMRKDVFNQMEVMFNDSLGRSLNVAFSDFFSSLHDLSNNPTGLAERTAVLGQALSLADVFSNLGNNLFDNQININKNVLDEVAEINSFLSEIARLNKAISANEPNPQFGANDLRDRRDRLVNKLAEKIDVTVVSQQNGLVSLTLQNGRPLVLGQRAFSLTTQLNGDNHGFNDILLDDGQGNLVNVTSDIKGGKLRAMLDMRDKELAGALDKLDRLAAGLIQEFNRVHQQGIGFNGSTGLNFFDPLSPVVVTNTNNTGNAQLSLSVGNLGTASIDKFEITMIDSNSFSVTNLTTGIASGTFTFAQFNQTHGLELALSGTPVAGDKFKFSTSERASRLFSVNSVLTNDPQKIAAGKTANGDGENARQMANIQNRSVFDGVSFKSGSGAFTFDDFYNSIVSGVGVSSRSARASLAQQEGVMIQLKNRRESAAGVSIDEEMINLIKFQQAFNAAARLITTVNEMLDILQNRI